MYIRFLGMGIGHQAAARIVDAMDIEVTENDGDEDDTIDDSNVNLDENDSEGDDDSEETDDEGDDEEDTLFDDL
jgi:hypothetical protein